MAGCRLSPPALPAFAFVLLVLRVFKDFFNACFALCCFALDPEEETEDKDEVLTEPESVERLRRRAEYLEPPLGDTLSARWP